MWALLWVGCAEPPAPGRCPSNEMPALTLASRSGTATLVDGDEVEVFLPPQGGVFTELDVSIIGVAPSEFERLRVTIDSTGGLGRLAAVDYLAQEIPLWCNEDEVLTIDDLPVGFEDAFELPDLDAEAAVLEGIVETHARRVSVQHHVVLRWTEY